MLSLAAWHLMVRARETPRRQWAAFAGCAMLPVACGTAYLVWLSVVGGERSGFLAFSGVTGIDAYQGTTPLVLPRVGIFMRDLFAADWISWPVFLWFAGMLSLAALRNRRPDGTAGASRRTEDSQQCVASSPAGAPRRPGASERPGASSRARASARSRASNRTGTPGRGRREAHASPEPPGPPGDDLPRDRVEALGRWVRRPGTRPDWIVIFEWMHKPYRDRVKPAYAVAAQLVVHPCPTLRPEIDKHAFAPLDAEPGGVSILRLRPAPRRGAP